MSTNEMRDRNGVLLSDAPSVRIPLSEIEAMIERTATIEAGLMTATENETELIALRAALDELIACRDLKEHIDKLCSSGERVEINDLRRLRLDYELRKPLAWAEARRLRGKTCR